MATEHQHRICPTCGSPGTCSRSHKRGLGEDLLALLMPVVKPYRCRACNWRGYMGVMPIAKGRIANAWVNSLLYLAIVIAILIFIVSILSERS
jgi:hypothetical protein